MLTDFDNSFTVGNSTNLSTKYICTFSNFHVSHGSATRFLRDCEKYYISFVDNLSLFPIMKEFSKSVNI